MANKNLVSIQNQGVYLNIDGCYRKIGSPSVYKAFTDSTPGVTTQPSPMPLGPDLPGFFCLMQDTDNTYYLADADSTGRRVKRPISEAELNQLMLAIPAQPADLSKVPLGPSFSATSRPVSYTTDLVLANPSLFTDFSRYYLKLDGSFRVIPRDLVENSKLFSKPIPGVLAGNAFASMPVDPRDIPGYFSVLRANNGAYYLADTDATGNKVLRPVAAAVLDQLGIRKPLVSAGNWAGFHVTGPEVTLSGTLPVFTSPADDKFLVNHNGYYFLWIDNKYRKINDWDLMRGQFIDDANLYANITDLSPDLIDNRSIPPYFKVVAGADGVTYLLDQDNNGAKIRRAISGEKIAMLRLVKNTVNETPDGTVPSGQDVDSCYTRGFVQDTPKAWFRHGYPFSLTVVNRSGLETSPAIYILSDTTKFANLQQLRISIRNTTQSDYTFKQLPAASVTDYHFKFTFRPGALHADLEQGAMTDKFRDAFNGLKIPGVAWLVNLVADENNHEISWYVAGSNADFTLDRGVSWHLDLQGVYAAPGTGTRTSALEAGFGHFSESGNSDMPGFSLSALLQIINHQGTGRAPLHFGVLGDNFLLNNTTNAFNIYMQVLNGLHVTPDSNTRISFSFQAEDIGNAPVGFGNKSEVQGIQNNDIDSRVRCDHSDLDPKGNRDIVYSMPEPQPLDFLKFSFTNMAMSGQIGIVKLLISVQNLPGYWDTDFEVPFVKGPMKLEERKVTIDGGLDVNGAWTHFIHNTSGLKNPDNAGGLYLAWNRSGGAGETNLINTTGPQGGNGGFTFDNINHDGHRSELMTLFEDGSVSMGQAVPLPDDGKSSHAVNIRDGKVGIGTADPVQTLHVEGNTYLSGNVGIGAENQAEKLHVEGNTSLNGKTTIASGLRINGNDDGNNHMVSLGGHGVFGIDAPGIVDGRFVVLDNGNVGIGTSSPGCRLDVAGDIHSSGTLAVNANSALTDSTGRVALRYDGKWAFLYPNGIDDGNNQLVVGGGQDTNFKVTGTTHLSTLYVTGFNEMSWTDINNKTGESWAVENQHFDKLHNDVKAFGSEWKPMSIIADYGIFTWCAFYCASDIRIKKNISGSSSLDDLSLLNSLRVVSFQYKNTLLGHDYTKGFIAQEVEQVYAPAVSTIAAFIPDIFETTVETDITVQELTVYLKNPHHLSTGDMVRIITKENQNKDVEAVVLDDRSFKVANWTDPADKLFVFGKKVHDLKSVDYQQIFTLGISAIQELSREVDGLKEQLAAQEARLVKLEQLLTTQQTIVN